MRKHLIAIASLFLTTSFAQAQNCDAVKAENKRLKAEIVALKGGGSSAPAPTAFVVQTQTDKNLTFKVTSVAGDKRNQTVTVNILLSNSGANLKSYNTSVTSFIDDEGNEYELESATLGKERAVKYLNAYVTLYTDTPLKTSYTFKGVLPKVGAVKLLSVPYNSDGNNIQGKIEFRSLQIAWK